MSRVFLAAFAALSVCSCSDDQHACPYQLWNGSWSGSGSYTSTNPAQPNGVAGASALDAATEVTSCGGATGSVTLGGCSFSGQFTGPRSMVFEAAASACVVQLASETLSIRVRQGSALIAANDTLELSIGGDLVSRQGQAVQNATITFDFDGRRP
jgi:hypothetical protein